MTSARPRITVIGSINMDLVVRCARLPAPGETILADSSQEICGGKGANQAVAAARAGGNVSMVGRVGDDGFADRLAGNLENEGIDCAWVQTTAGCASGVAVVAVEQSGQNAIMVVPGANGRVTVEDVHAARGVIEASDIVLVQLEVPLDTVLTAMEVARSAGVRVILDPAPAPIESPVELQAELLQADLLCPNESEAAALTGLPVDTVSQVEDAARELQRRGAKSVAITLGEQGCLLRDGDQQTLIPPYPATVVDTTAAGDAFAGALAVLWAEGAPLAEAVRFANAAGALAASQTGAQPSMAHRTEITNHWRSQL